MKKRRKSRPTIAYGESEYDFSGQSAGYRNWFTVGDTTDTTDTTTTTTSEKAKDTTTKTLIYVAIGAIAFTGILIFVLGRRRKG